ncbi:MAG: hypothetical protein GEU94_11300 [Micromonosporaceae bacterium]|nr:hypothetical protein [Micromonosporaceae bacterium]
MGTILVFYGDAAYDHEGYAAQVLDDGTLTGTYSAETEPRMVGQVVAACDCGWTGTTRYPTRELFDEHAEDLALAEWEHTHARPVLDQAQRGELSELEARLRGLSGSVSLVALNRDPVRLADELASVVRRLEAAAGLARRLHNQVQDQHGGGRRS